MKNVIKDTFLSFFFFSFSFSISMNSLPDKYTFVRFKADDGIVSIEKKNIPLIGALYERYDLYLKSKYKRQSIAIPLLKGTLKEEIVLVNDALNVRPDQFATYFSNLQENEKDTLLTSSLIFSQDRKKVGLHVPELTKRLLSICLKGDLYNPVMCFFDNKEKDDLTFHCRSQLIKMRSSIGIIKRPILEPFLQPFDNVDLQTLFINGYFSGDTGKRPIPLRIGNETYNTYAYNFVSADVEFRVTEQLQNKNASNYLLWIINHKNSRAKHFSIEHSSPLIGCCFSATKTDIEYVVTYSENDIIFSTINMCEDGFYDVNSIHVDTASKGKNFTAAYCGSNNTLVMGMYQGTDNVFIDWSMDGIASLPSRWPFKLYGLLEKINITKNNVYKDEQRFIFGVCGMYEVHLYRNEGNVPWAGVDRTGLTYLNKINELSSLFGNFFQKNNEVFMYDCSTSFFSRIQESEQQKQQYSLWDLMTKGVIDNFNFVPDDECYKKYSSSGQFILCNSLKKESGLLYVKTEILDSITHKPMLSLDTLYKNFVGVGFDDEEKKLIFIHHHLDKNAQVLLWNEQDTKDLEWLEKNVLKDLGTVSVMARLLAEIQKNGNIVLKESDPLCTMLREWAKESPHIQSFLEKCFPMRVIKG